MAGCVSRVSLLLAAIVICSATVFAQSKTVTRFEQSDSRIAYSGMWYPNGTTLNSAGSAILGNLKGSQAVVTFKGTGITWIGTADPFCGIAHVYLDGTPHDVDTASTAAGTLYQHPLFTARGLTSGVHTLTIEITHSHDAGSNQSWVWIDAFDVENGSLIADRAVAGAGLAEQTNPALNYGGVWFQNAGAQYSGGNIAAAMDTNSWVSVSFNGTAVDWIGYRDEWSGVAQVYVDGAFHATVDTYLSPWKAQSQTYSVAGLAPGPHTLKIVATGTHASASGGAWIWVDAFNITGKGGVPTINTGGVVSAASYSAAPDNRVSPGEIISIFGSNFLPNGRADASALPLPTELGANNVTVTACGRSIPLFSVFPGQINAQLPYECPVTGTTPLTVTAGGVASAAQTVILVPASPGLFTVHATGSGDGAIVHGNGVLVSAANPARGGEEVVIYCAGLGATTPSFPAGAAVTAPNRMMNSLAVTIGDANATVVYSGLTVGFAGLYQINVIIPAGLSGSQSVVLTAGSTNVSRAGVNVTVAP